MTKIDKTITKEGVLSLFRPDKQVEIPLILDSPHSGRTYPRDFNALIPHDDIICGEDRFVDELFGKPQEHGATWLYAEFPRSYIDVNRHYTDIHPRMIKGKWEGDFPLIPTEKSSSGIGLIREHFHDGRPFYEDALSAANVKERIAKFYTPYHQTLSSEIERIYDSYGEVYHLNCHSMPSTSAPKLPHSRGRADIVLGTLDGVSASQDFTDSLSQLFKDNGFTVMLNKPYKGVEIVSRYGNPQNNRHSIQIEINRALYLDLNGRHKNEHFDEVSHRLQAVTRQLSRVIRSQVNARGA
jgi:N-formylglutamate deformylase